MEIQYEFGIFFSLFNLKIRIHLDLWPKWTTGIRDQMNYHLEHLKHGQKYDSGFQTLTSIQHSRVMPERREADEGNLQLHLQAKVQGGEAETQPRNHPKVREES